MRLGVKLRNSLRLMLRPEVCQLQAKGLCSGSDIILLSTLLRIGLGNKSEAFPSVSWCCGMYAEFIADVVLRVQSLQNMPSCVKQWTSISCDVYCATFSM